MNHVLMLSRNNLALTMQAAESVRKQDIPTILHVVDNDSSDGTKEWLKQCSNIMGYGLICNCGVSYGWNYGLDRLFNQGAEHVLVINNDVWLPSWFYSELLSYGMPFVSGVSVDKMEQLAERPARSPLVKHPDFSAFLIDKMVWEKVGPFSEKMVHYASDNDFHVRAHKAGIPLWKANVPFYHERSSTLNHASAEEREAIGAQANKDRAVFQSLYGVMPWGEGYDNLFS